MLNMEIYYDCNCKSITNCSSDHMPHKKGKSTTFPFIFTTLSQITFGLFQMPFLVCDQKLKYVS